MASRIIDEFKVKRQTLFSSWRYAQVLVDDNGTVTWRNKPGENNFDEDCISDYKYNNRNYKNNQLITEFCNLTTHTNYRIYAQDCKPFAYVQTDLNAAKCGYLEPLPAPADPPNPFGTLIYRPYKYTEFCDFFGNNIRVDILRKYNYVQPQTIIQVDSFVKNAFPPVKVKVFVDRIKHTVSYTGMAQNDSNSTRVYAPDELITEICDMATGINLKVHAQSAYPFAYIVEEDDAEQCQIPTVEPDYIENWGSPVIMDYKTDGDDKNPQFAPCEVTLNLISGPNFSLQDLYTEDEREFQVVIKREDQVIFKGYLIPDSCQEPFIKAPYEVSIKATDGIGALKTVTYTLPISTDLKVKQRFIDIIGFALAPTNLNLNIRTVCNVYETTMANGVDDDPLAQASVSPLRLAGENGNIRNCYEVLEEICKIFKACLYQANGEWRFERRSEYAKEKIRSRLYNHKAFFLYSEQLDAIRTLGNFDHNDIQVFDPQPDLYRGNAYKRVEVLAEYGEIPSTVFNGGFDLWDGQNFAFWTKYGNMQIDRVQKTIPSGTLNSIPINDFAMLFKERAQPDKWIECNRIIVFKGDSIRLSFNNSAPIVPNLSLKIRVKVDKYYLTNNASTGELEWVETLSTLIIPIRGTFVSIAQLGRGNTNVTFPDAPTSGDMILQFYGPQDYTLTSTSSGASVYVENNNYWPLDIDNVIISKQSKVDEKLPVGMLHISEQGGYYTKKPDQMTIIYSDYTPKFTLILDIGVQFQVQNYNFANPELVVGGTKPPTQMTVVIDDLYAIYTADGSYSTAWYEYGSSSGRVPIGLLLSKSTISDYQKPYWYASGNYIGDNLVYSNSFRFDFECEPEFGQKIFTLLSCTFDIKSCTMTSVNLAELFDKYIKTVDISNPSYPGDVSPPFINDPNSPPTIPQIGIFTDEFTTEFL